MTEGDLPVSPLVSTERPDAVPSGTVSLDGAQMAAMIAAGARLGAKTELLVDLLLLDGLKLGEVLAANAGISPMMAP
ncbi:MAG: hypothetical protein R2755_09160 [Acidimicrobiales bacterium]